MKAAGLKAIDTVVESTATLIRSKHPSNQKLVDMIASRISGVISKCCPPFPPLAQAPDSPMSSCPKVHPLPVQHRPVRPKNGHQDHARKKGAFHHGSRGSGMGGCQCHGAEREHSDGHGRADGLWRHRYISVQYSEFENRMIETHVPCVSISHLCQSKSPFGIPSILTTHDPI